MSSRRGLRRQYGLKINSLRRFNSAIVRFDTRRYTSGKIKVLLKYHPESKTFHTLILYLNFNKSIGSPDLRNV